MFPFVFKCENVSFLCVKYSTIMNLKLFASVGMFFFVLLYKLEKRRKPTLTMYEFVNNVGKDKSMLRNVYVGVLSGFLLTFVETGFIYDSITSKSKKLVSLDTVVNETTGSFGHSIAFFVLGNLFFAVMSSLHDAHNIPLWAHSLGIWVGFVVAMYAVKYHHTNVLSVR
jgi:uncharacterized protein with PQ loop repeat